MYSNPFASILPPIDPPQYFLAKDATLEKQKKDIEMLSRTNQEKDDEVREGPGTVFHVR